MSRKKKCIDAFWSGSKANRVSTDPLRLLFVPFASAEMETFPVGSWVSNPKHEVPRCLEPAAA